MNVRRGLLFLFLNALYIGEHVYVLVEKTRQAEVGNGEERAASTFIFYKAESGFLSTSLET